MAELSNIRGQLDQIDGQLLDLFLQRMELIEQVTDIKKEQHQPLYDPNREREILQKVHARAGAEHAIAAHQYFRTILELSRSRQAAKLIPPTNVAARIAAMCTHEEACFPQTGRVACSGIEGSNAQTAADKLFPHGDILYMNGFAPVVQAVKADLCQFGVLPIENSNNGSVRAVYDLLRAEPDLSIVRSIRLLIRHVLLARPGTTIDQIRTIYTHEQAAGQCSRFLSTLPHVDIVPCTSTAHAAQRIAASNDPTVAAIASEDCAKLYGLTVVRDTIQNQQHNDTRFLCITKGARCYAGADRMSLLVTCSNAPGSLYHMIAKISALGLNMCKLESVPIPGSNFTYQFFLDLEASLHQDGVLGLLAELERSCDSFALLGVYQECAG